MMATGFDLKKSQDIPALNLSVEEYDHSSGAKHFHFANDYDENVFMVAFRTVPNDSTGVAHILEHTALCGSEKFPVRDPFFTMTRRSLNTFMNAFTTSDYTAYPFASQNRKDYFNLMQVYLDAVFFSRLDPLDFAQEGHRVEFEVPEDPTSALLYKGVVYNEMKGDNSSPVSRLYNAVQSELYPTSTYHFNSGGDPRNIPDLSYKELLQFYQTHYHPSNAVFMTFGNISAIEQQQKIGEYGLNRLDPSDVAEVRVLPENRYSAPRKLETRYPVDDSDLSAKTHIVIAWLLGANTDLKMLLKGHLLSDVLLDTSASPLRYSLEQTEFATGLSPLSGFEEDHYEMNFMVGVQGSEPEHADAIEELTLETLTRVAEDGVPFDQLEAVLHQLELNQREVGGDGMPFGLQLIFSCMSAAIHRGDPIALLDIDSVLAELREEIREPDFVGQLIQELLLSNPHRVRVVMKPSQDYAKEMLAQERSRLNKLKDSMSDKDIQAVIDQTIALQKRQETEENFDVLPQVTVADIPARKHFTNVEMVNEKGVNLCAQAAGTNGLSYHQVVRPLPGLTLSEMGLIPIYSQSVTEVGSAGRDYLETQKIQHSQTGGISCFTTLRGAPMDADLFTSFLTLSSRTLNAKSSAMLSILQETSTSPNFSESNRLKDLIRRMALRRAESIASSGHHYAMLGASRRFRPVNAFNDYLSGVGSVMRLQRLAASLANDDEIEKIFEHLARLHTKLCQAQLNLLLISDTTYLPVLQDQALSLWNTEKRDDSQTPEPPEAGIDNPAYVVTTQVNHCAAAFKTVAESHPDAAPLNVLSGVLGNNFLHPMIREKGGAYGGGASHDSANGVFRLYSYRDPRLLGTFDDFAKSVEDLMNGVISDAMLEEAVLGVMSSIDAPGSPAGEVRAAFHHLLHGRSAHHRENMRQRYLEVRQDDVKKVAEKYLNVPASLAVVTSEQRLAELNGQFNIIKVNE